jgi:hypothetical protein
MQTEERLFARHRKEAAAPTTPLTTAAQFMEQLTHALSLMGRTASLSCWQLRRRRTLHSLT